MEKRGNAIETLNHTVEDHLESLDVAVLLKGREHNVEEPESEEHGGADLLGNRRAAQLTAAHHRTSPDDEKEDGNNGEDTEDGKTESERAWIHFEILSHSFVVNGGH